MRFIDVRDVETDLRSANWRQWSQKAADALSQVLGLDGDERKKKINAQQSVWSEIRPVLSKASNGKCWYCETKELRSDKPVDHFRPKNRVAEDDTHEGYWWLAFQASNYRFGCTFCNSFRRSERTRGGKQDRFPLLDEAKRARAPDDDWSLEEPVLLDPLNPADWLLLTFDGYGDAIPRWPKETRTVEHRRAQVSISTYHLNHPDIQEARGRRMADVRERLETAKRVFPKVNEDPEAKLQWNQCLRDLLVWKRPTEEFSAAAIAELKRHRDNPLAEIVLEGA